MLCVLVFDIIAYDNAYSAPALHVVSYVNHKMEIMETGLYHKIFAHLCAQHEHTPAHDTRVLSASIYLPFLFSLINYSILT